MNTQKIIDKTVIINDNKHNTFLLNKQNKLNTSNGLVMLQLSRPINLCRLINLE